MGSRASAFREIVTGRRRGLAAATLRAVLRAASLPYGWAIAYRNRRYDRGAAEVHCAPVPVICVGNLTVGGTGKTPMVEWIARRLREQNVRVAVLSRGYGAADDGRNDEALELELALPDVPHLQNPDRAASATVAVEELGMQMLLLDDGFQHRRLARDLDIVLLDASEPFGGGWLLPGGLLREPVSSLRRAGVVVLSRADMIDAEARAAIHRRVAAVNPDAAWCEVEHRPASLLSSSGATEPLDALKSQRVVAFCGIGNPGGFRHTLDGLGAAPVAWREFPDHHGYTRGDVDDLAAWTRANEATLAVCTRKDLVKLRTEALGGARLRAVSVKLCFRAGEDDFKTALMPIIQSATMGRELDDALEARC